MDMLRTQSIYFYFISERWYIKKRGENDKELEVNNSTQVPSPLASIGEERLIGQQCLLSMAHARCWSPTMGQQLCILKIIAQGVSYVLQ